MTMPDNLHGYHVHIYYDDKTEAASVALHDRLIAQSATESGAYKFG